jgi:hypothetical protein
MQRIDQGGPIDERAIGADGLGDRAGHRVSFVALCQRSLKGPGQEPK